MRKQFWLGAAALLAAAGPALAADQDAGGMVVKPDAASVRYEPGPPNLPKGTLISRVAGDPAEPGPFVLRLKFPAHTVIAPHTHAKPETLTILSGSIYHAHGRTLDRTKGAALTAGGFVYLPEDMPHSLWTTDEPVELQVNGSGPFGLNYIDPADDPSRSSGGPG
ncbi:cupin domain-containing protein [Methylobacterium sp. J-026]|uniref:cupin domain-containing protein n=1 Tax=Methylobacterium sp. J-026 TaxID=2836624 RepID=UPI001FB8DC7B|nr:cupin domain-containing protein [Methylobacterium sp. J-026]MCJ2134319.1 cupin domain-containing protein [Methylobacterium sp. J-026]